MKYINRVSVHCWGGLGSQLFAWAMAEYLAERFPKKHIIIVLHSNGVTRRLPSVNFLESKFEIKMQDDYSLGQDIDKIQFTQRFSYKKILKKILKSAYLVVDANNSVEKKRIKPWTRVLRGHYSYSSISDHTLNIIINDISKFKGINLKYGSKKEKSLGVHYRLGDLIQLPNKSYVKPNNLSQIIVRTIQNYELIKLELYSEDSKLANKMLGNMIPEFCTYKESEIWDTIIELSEFEFFIGTNSKISVWITILRIHLDTNSYNLLPISMKENIEAVLPRIAHSKNVSYYDDSLFVQ